MMGDPRSDLELLRASADDPEAFAAFYDRHAKTVLGFFMRRTGWPQLAADLTAETFAAAFASRGRYRDTGAPALSWLLGIGRHQLGTALRRERVEMRARKRLDIEPAALDDESYARIEELGELEDLRRVIDEALAKLSPSLAAAVSLRVLRELPYSEVAARLGCSEGAARVRVARGLTAIADLVDPSTTS